jgi:type III restriction enzyme
MVGTEVHQVDVAGGLVRSGPELVGLITKLVIERAHLTLAFAELYPFVRNYVVNRCFGHEVNLDAPGPRSHLELPSLSEGIAVYLAKVVGQASVETRPFDIAKRSLKLSSTQEFTWRRNLPLADCSKTIFNLVATYNDFEKEFARFLERAADVDRFAALGTTEQESGTQFRVNYVKPGGAIGYYHPDWMVVQKAADGEDKWVVETKGRVWEDTAAKDAAMRHWCDQVTRLAGLRWHYIRIDQVPFQRRRPKLFADLLKVAD